MAQEPKPQLQEPKQQIPDAADNMKPDAVDKLKPDAAGDIESGLGGSGDALYPKMTEDPALRWAFIRKVYAILSVQFLFTAAVATVGLFVKPIPAFFLSHSPAAWAVYLSILLSPLLVLWPMLKYRQKHPVNIILLALFTLCISLSLGVYCAVVGGKVVLQSAILTAAVLVGLTLYTFAAVRLGHDFSFLFPFLFCCLSVLLVFAFIQLFFPLGKLGRMVFGCLGALVFTGFIVHDTEELIKKHTYNEYVLAAISLYMDVINLFMSMVTFSSCH